MKKLRIGEKFKQVEIMFKLHHIKKVFLNWIDDLADFMDPDTGNLFEPISELERNDKEKIEIYQKHVERRVLYEPENY